MIHPSYIGATKVDSEYLNENGKITMRNNTDTKLEVMQVQVDLSKNLSIPGASHKEELEGYKSKVDGRFEVALERMNAVRKISDAKHEATLERIDGNQRAILAQFNAMRTDNKVQFDSIHTELSKNKTSMKLWFIGTIATILAVAAGLIIATITIIKAISDSQ